MQSKQIYKLEVCLRFDFRSDALQRLPIAIKALQQSTEPYLLEYLNLDMQKVLKEANLEDVQMKIISERHSAFTGIKPM